MQHDDIIDQLAKNGNVYQALLADDDADFYNWKPDPVKWSLLEIVSHLVDEEREDFRARISRVLQTPETAFEPIDPPGWVESRKYASNNFQEKANELVLERQKSIEWLRSLEDAQWLNGYNHEHFGRMTGTMLLSNWLAHDYLHIRQITRYHFEYLKEKCKVKLDYAGRW